MAAALLVVIVAGCGHRMGTAALLQANGAGASASASNGAPAARAGSTASQTSQTVGGPGTVDGSAGAAAVPDAGSVASGPATGGDATSGTTSCSTPNDTGPISIGAVGNLSGPAGSALAGMEKGLQVWGGWVNQHGGLCGRQVQIIVVDDHSDPAQYRAALQDLVENRHVVAFSNAATLTAEAGISYIESVHVPVIGSACANEPEFASTMYFLACAHPGDLTFGTAKNAALFGPQSHRLAIVTCRESAACGAQVQDTLVGQGGAQAAGMSVVYNSQASIAQPDYTSECQAAQSAGAEIMSVFLDAASLRRFGRSCQRQGYVPVYAGIAGTIDTGLASEPGYGTVYMIEPIFPFTDAGTPSQQEFHQAIDTMYGAPAGPDEAQGWTYGKMFEKAATVAAQTSGRITSASLIDALHTFNNETFDGLTIPLTYPAGGPGVYPSCWFVLEAQNGAWSSVDNGQPMCR